MADYPYYPYQWIIQRDCDTNMKVQNKDGKKPASCEEQYRIWCKYTVCQYVGYYPDNSGSTKPRPEFHHCMSNTFSSGCRDALAFNPRLYMNEGSQINYQ